MELAELMQSFNDSMKAAKKDSEARASARSGATVPNAAAKPALKRGRPKSCSQLRSEANPETPPPDGNRLKDALTPVKKSKRVSPPHASRHREHRVDKFAEMAGKENEKAEQNATKPDKMLLKTTKRCETLQVPTKRSPRIANIPTIAEKMQKKIQVPQPFDAPTRRPTTKLADGTVRNKTQAPEEPMTSAAATTSVITEGSAASDEPSVDKSMRDEESLLRLARACEAPDPRACWQRLQNLMKQLSNSEDRPEFSEDPEIQGLLDEAVKCISGNFLDAAVCRYSQLTAANSLLELAAAVSDGELAPIMTSSIATRCVLNLVALEMTSEHQSQLLNCLEPVPSIEHLAKFCGHLDELFRKSRLSKLSSRTFNTLQRCYGWVSRDDPEPRNVEVVAWRPAACAVLALSKVLAMEAAEAEAEQLVVLEARARVRLASKEAAEKVAPQLRSEFEAKQHRPCARAAVAAAADETLKEVKELETLNAEIRQGRQVLESWTSMLKAQAVPIESWGRPVNVGDADWVRMNDGQHLNDSLIDFFVSMLVGLLGGSRTHAFSSHFYARLAAEANQPNSDQGWQRVRTWTRQVRRRHVTGIFACDYLLVPLHHEEEHHWSLAVVCRPWAAIDQLDNWASDSRTTVAFLDSLYSPSSETRQEVVVKKICQYLECEWRVCGAVGTFQSSRVQAVAVDVPQQSNNFDCGIYVLEFVLQLLQSPWRLASLGQRRVTFQVQEDPRKRWRNAALKLRDMKEAAPGEGVESAWFAARLWLQELQEARPEPPSEKI